VSGPNSSYDPVQVTALGEEQVFAMRDAALAAIAAAGDLGELKQARTEHAGDRSPLGLANREIGALPPQAKKDAGMRSAQDSWCWTLRPRSRCWSPRPWT
jgi:phenylalanyl-tRNA synthetase alpha chain